MLSLTMKVLGLKVKNETVKKVILMGAMSALLLSSLVPILSVIVSK